MKFKRSIVFHGGLSFNNCQFDFISIADVYHKAKTEFYIGSVQ